MRMRHRSTTAPTRHKSGLHPRNRHRDGYDFVALVAALPELAAFVAPNRYGNLSIDFAEPQAVKLLNRALLKKDYAIDYWDIPPDFLCPPIPGRVDYLHYLADLLGTEKSTRPITVLDIGCGANLIYPLLGQREYGWRFVAVDIDALALQSAQQIIAHNTGLAEAVELRQQPSTTAIFDRVILATDQFDLSLCNPPFHASAAAAAEGTQRKLRNLARAKNSSQQPASARGNPTLNFAGQSHELFCDGGEAAFIHRMIRESPVYATQVRWFSTLVSKADNLPSFQRALTQFNNVALRIIPMQQGQKTSRILAWSFQTPTG